MTPRNQPTPRDMQRTTCSTNSATLAPTTNDNNRRGGAGRKSGRSPKPSAQRATIAESLPELHPNPFKGADALLEASKILVSSSTPFEPSTMPSPPLPIAASLTGQASPPAAATARAQRSPKEPVLTRRLRYQRGRRHRCPEVRLH
jgi:hypothetical protein